MNDTFLTCKRLSSSAVRRYMHRNKEITEHFVSLETAIVVLKYLDIIFPEYFIHTYIYTSTYQFVL